MNAISVPIASLTVDVARAAGLAPRARWQAAPTCCVPWNTYAQFFLDLEANAGGADALERLVRTHWTALATGLGHWRGVFVSDRAFLRFVTQELLPLWFPTVAIQVQDHGAHGLRVDAEIVPPLRPSSAFLRLLGVALSLAPESAGFGPARVFASVEERRASYRCVPTATHVAHEPAAPGPEASLVGRLDDAARRWALSRRQREVLHHVLLGLSNKEIAAHLNIVEGTVELHITQLLRKASVTSRTAIMALLWTG